MPAASRRRDSSTPALTFERLQEIADSLVWRRAEGVIPPDRSESWCVGFAGGWNSALRLIARELGHDGDLATKPYYDRIIVVTCPDGHDTYEWSAEDGKKMGAMACACGFTKACHRHRADEHHENHREALAAAVLRADKPAPSEIQQVVE